MSFLKAELRKRIENSVDSKTENEPEEIPDIKHLLDEIEITDEEDLLMLERIEQREPLSIVDTLIEVNDVETLSSNDIEVTNEELQAKFDEIAAKLEGVF